MGSRSIRQLLRLPLRLHGIRLGQPVDLLLDPEEWRALGLVVLCGDGAERFLAAAAAELRAEEIAIDSAFVLLENVGFYRERSRSFQALLGTELAGGVLADGLLAADGTVTPARDANAVSA